MKILINTWQLFDNYVIARWQNRPSTALFWYLPEPATITSSHHLVAYERTRPSPFYLLDYRQKLKYKLENQDGIIVLPYHNIGQQVNPEAAFQYALGLHDEYYHTEEEYYKEQFLKYAQYFLDRQTRDGLWAYDFDWYGSKAPWYSALAQSRGASVMLRAFLITKNEDFLRAAKNAFKLFTVPTFHGGFLHVFKQTDSPYFEEYPETPTGVINGMMASLLGIWECQFFLQEKWLKDLWHLGIKSLQSMFPYYNVGWWSLYDLDHTVPIMNVNSPRYHLLEMNYLNILAILSDSSQVQMEYEKRKRQYERFLARMSAVSLKGIRKVLYR